MDPLDLLTGSYSTENDVVMMRQEAYETGEHAQEEKNEDNSSSSSSDSEDEPDQDMDFPTTQVLVQELVDVEMKEVESEKPPMSPVAIRSPVKARASPAKPRNSPAKPRNSPAKVRSSPVKARASPVLVDVEMKEVESEKPPMSPVAIRSPVKARASPAKPRNSPAKVRSSPVKAHASPVKVRSSPVKARASPVKARSSPAKVRSSPAKMRSPVKARSPAKPRSSPVKAVKPPVAPSPIVERLAEAEKKAEEEDETPEEFRAKGAEGKFTKVFPVVAKLVETGGWQIAQGMNTLFCAMPGVQFFNFKPNINVFDSKIKACWKFIQIAGEKKVDTEDTELWNMLWPIVEKEFGWFTMMCGPETWFVKPNTKFENFLPNETVFQSKKRAVLK
ncbi:SH3 domain containing protein, partial [Phytophthora palmivora]